MSRQGLILSAVGDIMLGDLPACSGFGVGSMIVKHGPRFPFAKVKAELENSDIVLGNLEVVLSRFDVNKDHFGSTHLRAQPEAVDGLRWAGINALTMANNHMMQHGRAAVLETIELLRKNNIAFTGIEDNEARVTNLSIVEKKGVKIGLLGYNFRPEQYFIAPRIDVAGNIDKICSDIEAAKNNVDFIVLSLHWGEEFINRPSAEQVKLGRRLIDSGAHVVLGHHPHILQGVEKYRGRIIAYSLGDFIFDLWQLRLRKSMILKLHLKDPNDIGYEINPILINKKWQPQVLNGAEAVKLKSEIEALSVLIDENANEQEWKREVAREERSSRQSTYLHYLYSAHRFGAKRFWENFKGIVGRRIGIKTNSY